MATIVVYVISIWGAYGWFNQLIIVDGDNDNDNDIIALGPHFKNEYNQIVEAFNNGQCIMFLFKNITISSTRDQYLRTVASTIVSTIVDTFTQLQLQVIHNKLCI